MKVIDYSLFLYPLEYFCSMNSQIRFVYFENIFTTQQKINTTICFTSLFFILINKRIRLQIPVIHYVVKFKVRVIYCYFLVFFPVIALLFPVIRQNRNYSCSSK